MGGNRLTAYNWESNWSNAGSDWIYSSDNYLASGTVTGDAVKRRADATLAKGATLTVTVPMIGYVAADAAGTVAQPFPNLSRFLVSKARNPAGPTASPDKADGFVYQDDFVKWVDATYPGAKTAATGTILYTLDNEPDLWTSTHGELRTDLASWKELRDRSVEYATMIKDMVPSAVVLGPGHYGWLGMVSLQGGAKPAGTTYSWFIDYFLDELRKEDVAQSRRLLDVLDIHWYTEAKTPTGAKVGSTSVAETLEVIDTRVQTPRSLWDPEFIENSWITSWNIPGCTASNGKCPIMLLPRMQQHLDDHYPGTRLAITELYYGGGNYISGAVTHADMLGIFGREGLYASAIWPLAGSGAKYECILQAYAAFVDYDGAGSRFGNRSISTVLSDALRTSTVERVTGYGSVDQGDPSRVVAVAINKSRGSLTAALLARHAAALKTAEVYQLTATGDPTTAGCTGLVRGADITLPVQNAFRATLPPLSVTVFVLKP